MAKLLNGATVYWSPPRAEGDDTPDDKRPTFSFRPPSVFDKSKLTAACIARGAIARTREECRAIALEGVAAILPDAADPDRVRVEALLALEPTADAPLTPEQRAELLTINATLRRHYPAYAEAVADNLTWNEALRLEAFRLHCIGWRNVTAAGGRALPFKLARGAVDEHVLGAMPDELLELAAAYALSLFAPSEAERKNLSSPSSSPSTAAPSPAASDTPPTGPSDGASPTAS